MKTQNILVLLLLNILSICSFAQDSTISVGGRIQFDNISYFNRQVGKINSRNEGLFQLEIGSRLKETTQWKAIGEVREDISDRSRNRIWIDELWVKHKLKFADITLGKQIVEWGTTDGINPVNNVNPIDFSDFLDTEDEIIGVYGIRSQLFFGSFDIDLVWMPIVTMGNLPSTTSRWFPSLSLIGIPQQIIDVGVGVDIQNQMPELTLKNSEIGVRIRKRFSGFDLGFSYYNGFDHLPELKVDTLIMHPHPLLNLKGMYYRHQVFGVELSIALPNGFSFRGESAYFAPERNKPMSNRYIQSAVGIDRSFSFSSSNLVAIVQYLHDYQIDGEAYKTIDTRHIFQNSIATSLDLTINNGISAKLVSMVNLDSKDYIIRPELNYLTTKGLKFIVRADILEGKDDTFFGIYSNNNRIQCKVEYKF